MFFLIIYILGFISFIRFLIKRHRQYRDYDPKDEVETTTCAVKAKVISKNMDILNTGTYRYPSHKRLFLITFLSDDGVKAKYLVPQAIFENCTENSVGTLVTVNGEFFDFGNGEDIK